MGSSGSRLLLGSFALALLLVGPASARPARYGGTLVVRIASDLDTLDPTTTRSGTTFQPACCEPLYQVADNHGDPQLVPVLAAALPVVSADKLSYTVELRAGMQFNDGSGVDAQAVVSTYRRYLMYPGSTKASNF